MKPRQILGLIITIGFLVHAFITPVFFVEWIVNFMAWAAESFGNFISDAILNAMQ